MHSFHRKFESIGVMKLKLMEEFGEQVPETLEDTAMHEVSVNVSG